MRRVGLIASLFLVPFISLFWASHAFIAGTLGGWCLILDEWDK